LAHRIEGVRYALDFARDMDEPMADRFVSMYVNDYTVDLADRGRRAIEELLGRAHAAGLIPRRVVCEFVEA
jgi:1,4-dihydroxy-6-naphthoate synthase